MGMPDSRWKAEMDARTLAEAEVIRSEPSRLLKAQSAAARLQEDEKKEAAAMGKVARGSRAKPKKEPPESSSSMDIKLGELYQ